MTAAFVVLAVFVGLSLVIATTAGAILLANGKLTLPGTNMRRLQHEKVALEVARMTLEREHVQVQLEAQTDLRLTRALNGSTREGVVVDGS